MAENELIELGVRIEGAKANLQDACVYLERFKKTEDFAVASLVLGNVMALRSRYMSWASERFGLGLNDAVLEATRGRHGCNAKKQGG